MLNKIYRITFGSILLTAATTLTLHAQEARHTFHLDSPTTKNELVALFTDKQITEDEQEITRGLKRAKKRTVEIGVSINLKFQQDSDKLTNTALKQLRPIGEALMADQLSNAVFLIEGHVAASKKSDRDLERSRIQAKKVREHLIAEFPLDPKKLLVDAYGSSKPKTDNPKSKENNRIVIVRL